MNTYIATTGYPYEKFRQTSGVYVVNHATKSGARKILEKYIMDDTDEKITSLTRVGTKEGIIFDRAPVIE